MPNGAVEHFFGERVPDVQYTEVLATRPVAQDPVGRVAVFITEEGAWLPGTKRTADEDWMSALVAIGEQVGTGSSPMRSFAVTIECLVEAGRHVELRTHILTWAVEVAKESADVRWMSPLEAIRALSRQGDKWAVKSCVESQGA